MKWNMLKIQSLSTLDGGILFSPVFILMFILEVLWMNFLFLLKKKKNHEKRKTSFSVAHSLILLWSAKFILIQTLSIFFSLKNEVPQEYMP